MKNKFFFREGYKQDEKVERIPSSGFSTDSDTVTDFIQEHIGGDFDVNGLNKEESVYRLRTSVDGDTFDKFIDDLFNEKGKRGDSFNVRLFNPFGEIDATALKKNADDNEGQPLHDVIQDIDTTLVLLESNPNLNSKLPRVDLRFRTAVTEDEIEPTEESPVRVLNEKGEEIQTFDEEGVTLKVNSVQYIEARVYTETNLVAISNSGVSMDDQKAISTAITDLGMEEENDD